MAKRERPTLDEETEIITEVKTKVTNTNQQATETSRKERLKRAKGRHTFPTSNGGGILECKQRRGVDNGVDWVINPIDVDVNTYERFQKASIKSYKLN